MTPLRKKMIRELELQRKSPKTVEAYVTAVAQLAQYCGRSPDSISLEEIREFLHHLITERKAAFSTVNQKLQAIRFFCKHVQRVRRNLLRLAVDVGKRRAGRRRWQHPFPREAFIPKGLKGSWDDNIIWWPSMIVHSDKMLFYYGGARYKHNVNGLPPEIRQIRIGMGWVPRDRLIGLETRKQLGGRGAFLTRPFVVEGDQLYVNASVRGQLRVEIVDPITEPSDSGGKGHITQYVGAGERLYDGFRRRDCEVIQGDNLAHQVRWRSGSIGKFKGKTVRLRFVFHNTTVWAFQIAATDELEQPGD